MCGRFTLWLQFGDLIKAFPDFEFPEPISPRYNIAPTQHTAVVPNDGEGRVAFFRWGLVPFWAKDPGIGNRMINARGETAAEKPAFRAAYRQRRCLVLADGFYEWRKEPGERAKTPIYIRLASGEPFAFAGLWEAWEPPADDAVSGEAPRSASAQLFTFTIITTEPNALVAPIHNRMPVILPRQAYERWLDPSDVGAGALDDLLTPYPAQEMVAYPVSRYVNTPSNDSPACIAPASDS